LDDVREIAKRINTRVSYMKAHRWVVDNEANLRLTTQAYLACTTAMDDALGPDHPLRAQP
jgi:hypothetical protein